MDRARFEHLMQLDKPEDSIRECQDMLTEATDANERASLLVGMHVAYCKLGRMEEARQTLAEIQRLEISDLEIRMNAEFCEAPLLVSEGRREEALSAFSAMLDRHCDAFKDPKYRYLYEDIQCRRASALVDLSRFKEALPILREAVSFSFDQPEVEQRVHFDLGLCLEDANDIEVAKQEYMRAVRLGLRNEFEEQALYSLARLHYRNGALAQAKQQLETILRDFPAPPAAVPRKLVYETLSKIYGHFGDSANEKLYADLAKRA